MLIRNSVRDTGGLGGDSAVNLTLTPACSSKNKNQKYRIIRKKFPRVYRYTKGGNEYFVVDCRSKQWGLKGRKNFPIEVEAVRYAQEIDEQIQKNGAAVSNNLIYQNKDVERWVTMLQPHGKTLDDAVAFYVGHIEEELKNADAPTIKELCLKWYEEKRDSKTYPLSDKTKTELKMYWNFITNRLGQYKANAVTSAVLKKLIENLGSSATNVTRRQYFRYIRMFFRWAFVEKFIKVDPTDGMRAIRVAPKEIQIFSPEEVEALLRQCEKKYPFLLGYYCLTLFAGLRPTEAQNADWEDLNFQTKEIYVKPIGKTGSRRFVLKGTDAVWTWLNYIKEKYPAQPLNPKKSHEYFQKKFRAELGKWHQDIARHSFGTYYHNLRRDILEVVYVMGNSVAIARKHYVREVTKDHMEKFWALKPSA